jgi:hypothetical protein
LRTYLTSSSYIRLFGCSGIDLSNTTAVYARYTISFLCNAIIQNSVTTCGLSTANSRPMCADSCVRYERLLRLASMLIHNIRPSSPSQNKPSCPPLPSAAMMLRPTLSYNSAPTSRTALCRPTPSPAAAYPLMSTKH